MNGWKKKLTALQGFILMLTGPGVWLIMVGSARQLCRLLVQLDLAPHCRIGLSLLCMCSFWGPGYVGINYVGHILKAWPEPKRADPLILTAHPLIGQFKSHDDWAQSQGQGSTFWPPWGYARVQMYKFYYREVTNWDKNGIPIFVFHFSLNSIFLFPSIIPYRTQLLDLSLYWQWSSIPILVLQYSC